MIQADSYSLKNMKEVDEFIQQAAGDVLGLIADDIEEEKEKNEDIDNELISILIELRKTLRSENNYKLADHVRDEMTKLGIVLKDTKDGTEYEKVSVEK